MRLATICARAGSKRLPGKNTRELHGKPLWLWTVQQAAESQCFDFLAISTDDPAVGKDMMQSPHLSGTFNVIRIKRPDELAGDGAGKVSAIRHALMRTEELTGHTFDHIVDLDVTAPLRNLDDIRGFCARLDKMPGGNLVSVCYARRSPYFNMIERYPYGGFVLCKQGRKVLCSQDALPCYELNASMYGWHRAALMRCEDDVVCLNTDIYVMPPERSWDIDDAHDLEIVEYLMGKQRESVAA